MDSLGLIMVVVGNIALIRIAYQHGVSTTTKALEKRKHWRNYTSQSVTYDP